jgi:hypothetical protein
VAKAKPKPETAGIMEFTTAPNDVPVVKPVIPRYMNTNCEEGERDEFENRSARREKYPIVGSTVQHTIQKSRVKAPKRPIAIRPLERPMEVRASSATKFSNWLMACKNSCTP